MAIYKCTKCGTLIKINYIEKCFSCGGRTIHQSGYVKDQDKEKTTKKQKDKK